jgi:hypothetical protein
MAHAMHIKFTLSQKKKKLFFSVLIKKKKNIEVDTLQ